MRHRFSTLPNLLTLLRLAILPLLANFVLQRQGLWAAGILFLAGVTDFFDGYLARRYKEESVFGKLMDPVADKILLCVAVICLVATPHSAMSPFLAIFILVREFLIAGLRSFAASQGLVIGADQIGKTKTFLHFIGLGSLMLGLNELSPSGLNKLSPFFLVIGTWTLWASVILSYWGMVRYSRAAYKELSGKI